jgi:hypothetical protein
MKNYILILLMSLALISCGEEVLTQNTLSESYTAGNVQNFELNTCSQMQFQKPPVDILYVIDNSGSSLLPSFAQVKQQIANTLNTISSDFDYHIYIAPLMPKAGDSLTQYPVLASDQTSFGTTALNFVQINNLQMFAEASGNNVEYGFQRVFDLIDGNRVGPGKSGIFRNNAHTIVVMISNGDDTQAITTIGGNQVVDPNVYNTIRNKFYTYTENYAKTHSVSNPMNAQTMRFLSLVAHSNCQVGWKRGSQYISMSQDLYNYGNHTDDPTRKDSHNLCSGNYAALFSAINSSIKAVVVGHKYDHWKISSASESSIQTDDITVTKINPTNNSTSHIPAGLVNGFEYLGHKTNQNTRYAIMKDINGDGIPDEVASPGEPATGLMIKLNGTARVTYPECIIAKTRTPTEYFGFIALPREPQVSTISVSVRGQTQNQNTTNGWSYIGWHDIKNIKVPGPTGAAVTPAINKSGYFIQLHGNAIFTNGDSISVNYKPASL